MGGVKSAMSEAMEKAHETMHGGHGGHGDHADGFARGIGLLVSCLAAALAITEIGAKSSQNAYLTAHIAVSDDWAFYQAKNLRAVVKSVEVEMLESLSESSDPAVQQRIKDAKAYQARMQDDPKGNNGMKQLAEQAKQREKERDFAEHRYHGYEYAAGALQIGIVLASVSVVTRVKMLGYIAGALGIAATAASIGVKMGLV